VGVAALPAAVAVAGVVALLLRRGAPLPVVGASAVVASVSGGNRVRRRLSCWRRTEEHMFIMQSGPRPVREDSPAAPGTGPPRGVSRDLCLLSRSRSR